MALITLFHGPKARDEAVLWAETTGRLLAPADGGTFKVDAARDVAKLIDTIPMGTKVGTLVIGPMDHATAEASDALLKRLEECNIRYVHPALWAEDLERVSMTIQSRTIPRWCPAVPGFEPEAPFIPVAATLCDAALRGRVASIIETLAENEGSEAEILAASAHVLRSKEEWDLEARLRLWVRLREALVGTPSRRSTLAAFLGA